MRKILAFYAALALLCAVPAFVAGQQQAPSTDVMLELHKLHHQDQETQKRINAHQQRLEKYQEGTEQRFENFRNNEEAKREKVLRQSEEHENKLEAKISQAMSFFNTWTVILAVLITLAGYGWWAYSTKRFEDERIKQQKKTDALLQHQQQMVEEGRKLLEEQKQNRDKSCEMHLAQTAQFEEFQSKNTASKKPDLLQTAKYDDSTTRQAEQIREAEAQREKVFYQNILWSKAILAYVENKWADALPLWQVILQDEPDNPKALFSAAMAAQCLADETTEDAETTALLNTAISYYNKLWTMPQAEAELRAQAGLNLIFAYNDTEKLDAAQKIYDDMPSLGDAEAIIECRAGAAKYLILAYIDDEKLDAAQDIYDAMFELGDSAVVKEHRDAAGDSIKLSKEEGRS